MAFMKLRAALSGLLAPPLQAEKTTALKKSADTIRLILKILKTLFIFAIIPVKNITVNKKQP